MKILVITQSGDISGGANRSLLDVMQALIQSYGHSCFVVAPFAGAFTEALEKLDIPFVVIPYLQTSFVQRRDIFDLYRFMKSAYCDYQNIKRSKKLPSVIRDGKFDCVYINDTTNTFGYRLATQLNLPYVWHFRGYNHTIKRYMLSEKKFRNDKNGTCIMISRAMADYMTAARKMRSEHMTLIHNGVVNKAVNVRDEWHGLDSREMHLLHCGHLSDAKGQKESLKAVAHLVKQGYSDIYLHFAGTAAVSHGKSYKDILCEMIAEYGIEKNVIFEGEVRDMAALRQRMDVELMCSLAEPFGRVTVEGMQSGLVVIGCDTGATPEIIEDGVTGLIYPQGDHLSLAERIMQVYENRMLGNQLSRNALAFIKDHFTMEQNVAEIERVLRDTACKKGV